MVEPGIRVQPASAEIPMALVARELSVGYNTRAPPQVSALIGDTPAYQHPAERHDKDGRPTTGADPSPQEGRRARCA